MNNPITLQTFPTAGYIRVREHYRQMDKKIENFTKYGISANCLFDPNIEFNKISKELLSRLRDNYYDIVKTIDNTDELWTDEELEIIGNHKNAEFKVSFRACISDGENLGSDLLNDIDIIIGKNSIMELKNMVYQKRFLNPLFRERYIEIDHELCFVLMPFTEEWSNRIWRRHIQPTIESLGLKCRRADDFFLPNVVVDDIFKKVNSALILIADLTGNNPNVFYELGIAHALGRPVILLSQDEHKSPFNIAHWRQIKYSDNTDGCEKLESELKLAISHFLNELEIP